jgi:hypothetical protein
MKIMQRDTDEAMDMLFFSASIACPIETVLFEDVVTRLTVAFVCLWLWVCGLRFGLESDENPKHVLIAL